MVKAMKDVIELLCKLVLSQAPEHSEWITNSLEKLSQGAAERDLYIFFGLAPRRLGKSDLRLSPEIRSAARAARPGWSLDGWTVDGAARVLALLEFRRTRAFAEIFKDFRRTADVAELITLYRGLPLYPDPEDLHFEVGEGLRSNLRSVFEAIAHDNPFPKEQFDQHRWNHMVLKALFVGSPLAPIQGLDDRANADLALMLVDYARERQSAGRPISPELWPLVQRFRNDPQISAALQRFHADGFTFKEMVQ